MIPERKWLPEAAQQVHHEANPATCGQADPEAAPEA